LALISATLFLKLVGSLDLEGLSVASKGGLGSLLNLGLLGGVNVNVILSVWGASEGSCTSFLLLHVNLLGLSSHHVHLHGNLRRFGAVVLDNLENVDPRVDGGLGLGVLRCLDVLHGSVLLGKLYVHVVLGNVGPRGLGSFGSNLGNLVLDSSFTFSLPGVHN
jgi:hypothetical protein